MPTGWLIEKAGGIPVPALGKSPARGTLQLSAERLIVGDPDVIVVWSRKEVGQVYDDPLLRDPAAVRKRRVFAIPRGLQLSAAEVRELLGGAP